MPGLGASFGRGAATNYQQDLAHSDCILFMGSNMAEAHPVGFRWPMKAKEKGATLIHVDPRFSRTSALCDVFVGIRAGTDIAFLGGLIRHIIENGRWFKEYVLAYTNASTIIEEGYRDAEDLEGLFSGFHPETNSYDAADGHWEYEGEGKDAGPGPKKDRHGGRGVHGHAQQGNVEETHTPERDPTLQHPRCVFQLIRRHFARYTPELVARVCGCRPEEVVRVAELLCANSGRERTTALVYAVGWTQHTTGVQIIRCGGILQLLLGNVGRPGGGVMAMRGHSSIQGSTDVPTLYDLMPGYLPQPKADADHETLDAYVEHEAPSRGYWSNFRKFAVSLLKAWYGDAARPENDFRYDWLPRIDGDYSMLLTFDRMSRGEMKGYILMGMNPGGGGMNARLHRAGLRNLDWLVVADWFETESAVFWKDDPEAPPPSEIKTEVFFFPAAAAPEKDGTLTNTQRLLQWHNQAIDPPGDCRSDAWFVYNLGKRLKALYAGSTDPKDQPLLHLTWDYDFEGPHRLPDGAISRIEGEPDVARILQEINGHDLSDIDPRTGRPRLLPDFSALADDGSTACGCWIYSGVYPEPGRNRANERKRRHDPLSVEPDWGFAWPLNRRVLYNRASADPEGRPWSERKKLIWWDEAAGRWVGADEPDFEVTKPPGYRPGPDARGMDAIAGDAPFLFKPDGLGWLYAAGGVKDGPIPTHYEPVESPVGNLLYPRVTSDPLVRIPENPLNPVALAPTAEFPVVATTFRLTEHYLSGPMSRFNSWLNELQPEMFVELSPELAAERGIEHGGWLTVRSARGRIEARAMVTRRMRPLVVEGRVVHQVAIPFHWGFAGETVGGNANDLTSIVLDANVSMHEAKAFACEVGPGRLPGPRPGPTKRPVAWPTRDPVPDTPTAAQPEGGFAHGRE
ncbi:Formate dehydrogenase, nitrate-inducible, major subunit precursor [Aquisphaera giovannonii]|uniref:Formate dehydrogenase, nitrate-inducible, major subunit n=1 Tax=Aquisphaera giovannonii TaxID=406548 RepID=A0A5B9VU29_9BACT|nr:Formate dehydrogenase, nitrate-inducible, major subunit precursor [Aquisphaera giovannonii]